MQENSNSSKRYVVEEADSLLIPKINLQESGENQEQTNPGNRFGGNIFRNLRSKIPRFPFFNRRPKRVGLEADSENGQKNKTGKYKKVALIFLIILLPFLIQGLLALRVYQKGINLKVAAEKLVASPDSQDLEVIKSEISNTREVLDDFNKSYKGISWLKIIPYFGVFVNDGQHVVNAGFHGLDSLGIVIDAITPYADIVGFNKNSDQSEANNETTQDRLDFIVKTLPYLVSKADELIEKTSLIKKEIDEIDPDDYPVTFAGNEVREKVKKAVELTDLTANMVKNGKPLLEASPYLMGVDGERTYLIIFQNDKELRPTGGFITAYSIANVISGKFEPTVSDDIYNLDNAYTPTIPAPQPIIDYIKFPYSLSPNLRLRDMNWSPDFSESMDLFSKEIEKVGIQDIDGIIAVDTQVVVNLLEVIGPIVVPGYGTFSNEIIPECNCPQVIYELESFADIEGPIVWSENEPGKIVFAPPNYDNRKKIIGPLMNSMLSSALGQSNEKIPALFEAGFKSLIEKHVLFYLNNEVAQKAVEDFGIGGTIKDFDGDYLHINDSNLGGRKSNLYVTQEVLQEVDVDKDGNVVKTLILTYKNPEKHDGWLNSVLPNWVRIYVPKGSTLISAEGLEKKEEPYEELGKTVFAGFFELRPQGVARVVVKYKLPFQVDNRYSLFIQKQPGKDYSLYSFKIGKNESEMFLRSDKEFSFEI